VCAAGAGVLPNHHHKRGDAINIIRANRPTVVHHHFPWNDCTLECPANLVDCANVECTQAARHYGPCTFHDADRGT
jgi:hypothetical protein